MIYYSYYVGTSLEYLKQILLLKKAIILYKVYKMRNVILVCDENESLMK